MAKRTGSVATPIESQRIFADEAECDAVTAAMAKKHGGKKAYAKIRRAAAAVSFKSMKPKLDRVLAKMQKTTASATTHMRVRGIDGAPHTALCGAGKKGRAVTLKKLKKNVTCVYCRKLFPARAVSVRTERESIPTGIPHLIRIRGLKTVRVRLIPRHEQRDLVVSREKELRPLLFEKFGDARYEAGQLARDNRGIVFGHYRDAKSNHYGISVAGYLGHFTQSERPAERLNSRGEFVKQRKVLNANLEKAKHIYWAAVRELGIEKVEGCVVDLLCDNMSHITIEEAKKLAKAVVK